jgi:hypothetical protein
MLEMKRTGKIQQHQLKSIDLSTEIATQTFTLHATVNGAEDPLFKGCIRNRTRANPSILGLNFRTYLNICGCSLTDLIWL